MFARRGGGRDPHLEWKVRIFSVAAVSALLGMYFQERWMTGLAIVLLAGAMFLRFIGGAEPEADDDDHDGDGMPEAAEGG